MEAWPWGVCSLSAPQASPPQRAARQVAAALHVVSWVLLLVVQAHAAASLPAAGLAAPVTEQALPADRVCLHGAWQWGGRLWVRPGGPHLPAKRGRMAWLAPRSFLKLGISMALAWQGCLWRESGSFWRRLWSVLDFERPLIEMEDWCRPGCVFGSSMQS